MKNLSGQVGVYRHTYDNSPLFLSMHPVIPNGDKFGKWTVLQNDWYKSSKKFTDRACLVRCECTVERVVTYRALRRKISSSCIKCRGKRERDFETGWKCLYNIYRHRGQDFHLTLPQLKAVSLLPCVYCGKEPANLFRRKFQVDGKYRYVPEMDFHYSGIDRVDSAKGYIHGNLVPCCWECNRIKRAMSLEDFLGLIGRIQNHNPSIAGVLQLAASLFDSIS